MIDRETFNLRAFALEVAGHLTESGPGLWILSDEEYPDERQRLKSGHYEIQLTWSKYANRHDQERVSVSVNNWPTYKAYSREGRATEERVGPWSLYNPKESAPKITVAIARGAAIVAKEITRRVLPEYERLYKRCAEKACADQAYHLKARDGWVAVCAAINADPKHSHHYVRIGADKTRLEVENYGSAGEARVKIDVDADELRAIVAALEDVRREREYGRPGGEMK